MNHPESINYVESPKVDIAVVGRFHGFDLARELQKRGMLKTLLSTYPAHFANRWGIKKSRAKGEPFLEILRRYGGRQRVINPIRLQQFVAKQHACRAGRMIQTNSSDVFIGWTGSSLEALLEARKKGQTTILERGSSHCNEWRALMKTENAKFGRAFDEMPWFWQRELLEYELADYISVPSSFVRDSFIRQGVPDKKLLVNAYGVDLANFWQTEKADDTFRIINVGGFHFRKGSHYLLQALAEMKNLDFEFWHVGNISAEMQPLIDQYADSRFTFHGHQPQNELYKYYSQSSVFVLASIEEGMAMVQPQAMACGLPLICTTNTGGADLIGENGDAGFVVPIRDVSALKKRITQLFNDRDLAAQMGARAKARVASGFTWADYGNRYVANIHRVLKNKRTQQTSEASPQ